MNWQANYAQNPFQYFYSFMGQQFVSNPDIMGMDASQQMGIYFPNLCPNEQQDADKIYFLQGSTATSLQTLEVHREDISKELIDKDKNNSESKICCQCSKSQCVKSYCFCYKNGLVCGEDCSCLNCKNNYEVPSFREVPREKKDTFCNCSKSKCIKKYCECFASGLKCGENCKCMGCRN